MQQQSNKTIRKVKAASGGAAIGAGVSWAFVVLLAWLASEFGVILPNDVQMALEVIFTFVGPAVGAWVGGYFIHAAKEDVPIEM